MLNHALIVNQKKVETDKGHLISEQIYEDIDFPKLQQKYC